MGRPKGSPNKVTAILKAAVVESFEKLGGVDYLVWLGSEHPRAYATLLAKCIPSQLKADLEVNERPTLRILDYTGQGDVVCEVPALMPEPPDDRDPTVPEMSDPEPSQRPLSTNGAHE